MGLCDASITRRQDLPTHVPTMPPPPPPPRTQWPQWTGLPEGWPLFDSTTHRELLERVHLEAPATCAFPSNSLSCLLEMPETVRSRRGTCRECSGQTPRDILVRVIRGAAGVSRAVLF